MLGLNVPANRLKIVPIDGGSPGPSTAVGSDESDLDVEQSGAIAPGANVRLYEAPNSDPGFADAYYSAASDNLNDTLSISWGESETYILQTDCCRAPRRRPTSRQSTRSGRARRAGHVELRVIW